MIALNFFSLGIRKSLLVALVLLAIGNCELAHGQKLNIIPPSPEAAALGKYGNIPVSYYTGLLQVSVPIFTIMSGDIYVPITLSYHASGIRVDEEASWVGLGFSLQAGGVISRTVRGKDDFSPEYYFNEIPDLDKTRTPTSMLVYGCEMSVVNTTNGQHDTLDLSNFVKRGADANGGLQCDGDYAPDFEPDQYAYNFNGYSGKFILNRNREVILSSKEKIEITPPSTADAAIWEVRTKDGFKYVFNKYEYYQDADNCIIIPVKTAWYLSEIISPNGNHVYFDYKIDSETTQLVGSASERRAFSADGNCPNTGAEWIKVLSERYKKYRTVTLETIRFNTGKLVFHSTKGRVDLANALKLDSIEVLEQNVAGNFTPVKTVVFNYNYFNGSPNSTDQIFGNENDQLLKRLKLLSVQEHNAGVSKPPHIFNYYESGDHVLPSKGSFARDHWGYYNGMLDNNSIIPKFDGSIYTLYAGTLEYTSWNMDPRLLFKEQTYYQQFPGANREPSASHMAASTLKDITYPTGGKTEFKFEPHDFDEDASNLYNTSKLVLPEIVERDSIKFHNAWSDLGQVKEQEIDLTNLFVSPGEATGKLSVRVNFISTNGLNGLQTVNPGKVYMKFLESTIDVTETSMAKCTDGINYSCNCFTDNPDIPGTETKHDCEIQYSVQIPPGKYILKTFIAEEVQALMTMISVRLTWNDIVKQTQRPISMAGGLRVSEIIDYDTDGTVAACRKFNYHHQEDKDSDGFIETRSYGRRMSKPLYISYELDSYILGVVDDPGADFQFDCYRFILSSESVQPLNGSAAGSAVGYDKVEVLHGKNGNEYGTLGKTVYKFENFTDQFIDYGLWRRPGITNLASNRNGLLTELTEFKYELGRHVKVSETVNNYGSSKDVHTVYGIMRYLPHVGNAQVTHSCNVLLFVYPALQSEWIQLLSTTQTIYDRTRADKAITTVTNYEYENPAHLQVTTQTTTDSEGKVHKKRFLYPLDYEDSPSPAINNLIESHIVDPVIESIQTVANKVVSATATKYDFNTADSSMVLPVAIFQFENTPDQFSASSNGSDFGAYNKKVSMRYGQKGNVLEQRIENDITTSYIWGYNYSLVVAKIENAGFDQAVSALPVTIEQLQTLDGEQLRSVLHTMRLALPDARTTSLTYRQLVGITSQTDANGASTYFEYDDLGRLMVVKDNDGKLLRAYDYRYFNESEQ